MKAIFLTFLFSLSLSVVSYTQTAPQATPGEMEEFDHMMEQMMQELSKSFGNMNMDSLLNESLKGMQFLFDTSSAQGFMPMDDLEGLFKGFMGEEMDSTSMEMLFDQSLRMLESMDEKQMEELLRMFDISQMESMLEGIDMKMLEDMLNGMNLQVPDNYMDSLKIMQKENTKEKDLKKI